MGKQRSGATSRRSTHRRALSIAGRAACVVMAVLPPATGALAADVGRAVPPPPTATVTDAASATVPVGETQMAFLLQLARDSAQGDRGVPLEAIREQIARAVVTHPEALAARATQQAANEATKEIGAAALPQIDTRLDAARRDNQASYYLGVPARRYGQGSVGINLRQSVYDFGAIDAAVGVGRERETAVTARAENRVGDLALRAIQAWLEVYRSRMRLELARLNAQALETSVSFLRQRYELGAGLVSDIWRAQSRQADARAGVAAAQARVRTAESTYREVFRETAPAVLQMPRSPPLDIAGLTADPGAVVREFPAVRSAEAARRAAERDVDATERRTLPQIALELNALRRDVTGPDPAGNDLSATIVLRYNFYTGGADTARIGQADARATEAAEQARNISLQVERALEQALADEENSAALLAARREEVTLAASSLQAVRELFASRRGSLLDVLSAQESLNAAGLGLVDAQVEQALARWRVAYFTPAFWPLVGLSGWGAPPAPAAPPASPEPALAPPAMPEAP